MQGFLLCLLLKVDFKNSLSILQTVSWYTMLARLLGPIFLGVKFNQLRVIRKIVSPYLNKVKQIFAL